MKATNQYGSKVGNITKREKCPLDTLVVPFHNIDGETLGM